MDEPGFPKTQRRSRSLASGELVALARNATVVLALLAASVAPAAGQGLTLKPQPGLCFERVVRSKTNTKIVKPETIMTQVLETGAREVGRVMDISDGQVRIASKQVQSVLKVNGQPKNGTLPGAADMKLRVYAADGQLLRSTDPDIVRGDVRDVAVRLPTGTPTRGMRWNQTFHLSTGGSGQPIAVAGTLEYVGPIKVLGRDAHEVRGFFRLPRQYTARKLTSTSAAGRLRFVFDTETGMPLQRAVRLKMEQVREDAVSQAHVKAGGVKLGLYVEVYRDERSTYLGTKVPPGLAAGK